MLLGAATALLGVLAGAGCTGSSSSEGNAAGRTGSAPAATAAGRASDAARSFPLDSLATTTVTVNGHVIRVWLAQEFDPRRPGVVEEGLMHVPAGEIAADQGMLFVFAYESVRDFWMRNTITALDIAFARLNGTIVRICQMPPLTLRTFNSIEPAMFALEVKQGTFARLGVKEGDRLEIPAAAFSISE